MKLGILDLRRFRSSSLEQCADWAANNGFDVGDRAGQPEKARRGGMPV